MNIVKKVAIKLYKNFKILNYSLLTKSSIKTSASVSELIWSRNLAVNCGAYPVYFPKRREITDTFFGNLFLLTPLFMWLSYRNINKKLKKNNSVFVSLNEMGYFQKSILPKIKIPFVLVTGDSDYSTLKFKGILDNKYLLHWFAQNNVLKSKKLTPVPLGLDFHTLLTEDCFGEKMMSTEEQERRLKKILGMKVKKNMKIFTNFHLSYTSERRKELHNLLKNNPAIHFQKAKMPRTEMWKLQKEYAFNFSPVGNGLDCIRTWEALVLGQIPIVERTKTALDDMYRQFPVVVIDDISEINEKNMKKWYKKYGKMFDKKLEEKLTNKYWVGLIKGRG
jgi:hypothetical protein